MPSKLHSDDVVRITRECGFELAGIAPAGPVADFGRYRAWVNRGMAAEMRYLTDRRAEVRSDVSNLLPTARSVICAGKLYNTDYQPQPGARISRYAASQDYHRTLREGLERVTERLRAVETFDYKICVDTAPLLERSLARQAGLGWIGRNTCLINEPLGSWFLLGEIVTSLELDAGEPPPDRCGSCTRCIEACPTQAIVPEGDGWTLDSRLCISYLTIEKRGEIPEHLHKGIGDNIFGCDICQEVCPWNSKAPTTDQVGQAVSPAELDELATLTEDEFHDRYAHTPVARAKYDGFMRNVAIARRNRDQ